MSKRAWGGSWLCLVHVQAVFRGNEEHQPLAETLLLLFCFYLPALRLRLSPLCLFALSPSPQALRRLSCQPRRQAELNQTNLQKGKRDHRCAPPPPPPETPLTFSMEEELCCRRTGRGQRKREASRSVLRGLCSGVACWQLSMSSLLAHGGLSPSDNTALCNKGGLSHQQ